MLNVKIINNSNNPNPKYQTVGSSGMDIYANNEKPIVLSQNSVALIPTGLYLEIPSGYEAQVRSRSGLALNNGIFCLNAPGTIDSDYRGELGIILASMSDKPFTVNKGDRIAQIVFSKIESVNFEEVESIGDTKRGSGGFGSSGI